MSIYSLERITRSLKKNPIKKNNIASSFRDPSGFVFTHNGSVYRQINTYYQDDYELLKKSGLYDKLVSLQYLIPHTEEAPSGYTPSSDAWKVIKPTKLPFISYPYEWCFSMVKDAALLTLSIQKLALKHNMSLKDASAFNIQFFNGKPILIDTLSFEAYEEGKPWVAYKQFVEHFLSPLCLMSYVDVRLNRLSSVFLDGIPVDVVSSMLPFRTRLNLSLLIHIYAHASSKKKFSDKKLSTQEKSKVFSRRSLLGLIDNLEGTVKKLRWSPAGTQWAEYYEKDNNNYESESLKHKADLTEKFLKSVKPATVWDLGANTGVFSSIAAKNGASVISFDIDYGALEKHYHTIVEKKEKRVLPLFLDLTNPTPALGWAHEERESLLKRAPADTILALAVIHHLAISHNIPFSYLASLFSKLGKTLIVEFVDKQDSQVQKLLANRKDIFPNYTQDDFENTFKEFFTIQEAVPIQGSKRVLYLMTCRS